jgi:GT2 family glycosyltransferase
VITVLIVAYRPRLADLQAAFDSVIQASREGVPVALQVWHNDEGPGRTEGLTELYANASAQGIEVTQSGGKGNLGFGRAINAAMQFIDAPYVLVLNQDAIPEPGALGRLWQTALNDKPGVAAWEMRQIPYEHPKDYDPVTGDTGWCSGAAVLLRTQALRQVHGFEPRFFMYCEDVDLSWRLRCAGWRLRYLPQCAVVHHTYSEAGAVKPLAVLQGFYANLCLRARYGARRHVVDGVRQVLREARGPQHFAGRRAGLLRSLFRFTTQYAYFRSTRQSAHEFQPCFRGWDYEQRREGSFHPFQSQSDPRRPLPPVAVVVHARGTADDLREWLAGLNNQTHRPAQVLVVSDAPGEAAHVLAEFEGTLEAKPLLAGEGETLAHLALQHTVADWVLLASDVRHRLYADHVEVLLQAAVDLERPAACGQLWHMHAPVESAREAHRLHADRHVSSKPIAERPSPLIHRSALSTDWRSQLVEVPKLTAVRYAGDND